MKYPDLGNLRNLLQDSFKLLYRNKIFETFNQHLNN